MTSLILASFLIACDEQKPADENTFEDDITTTDDFVGTNDGTDGTSTGGGTGTDSGTGNGGGTETGGNGDGGGGTIPDIGDGGDGGDSGGPGGGDGGTSPEEVCDGVDNDGDGDIDEGFDADGDGLADCDDSEVCDGVDNDGDGAVDEGFDSDGDGVSDCFDVEYCDGLDNDGDGLVDEDDARDAGTWYRDSDGDTFGDASDAVVACDKPDDYTDDDGDCDDGSGDIAPDAVEDCDGVDNNCDDDIDELCEDECWSDDECLTWEQAHAKGVLEVRTGSSGTVVEVTNHDPTQDVCFDRALYSADDSQAFFADVLLVEDEVVLAPGETINLYYGSSTTENGYSEDHVGEYAWWCFELGQSTQPNVTYDFYGEGVPPVFKSYADVDTDEDGDSTEDHVDWEGSNVRTQYNVWDHQAAMAVLTAGKWASIDSEGRIEVHVLSRNVGELDGTGTLYDTVPAGWTIDSISPPADSEVVAHDGSTELSWDIEVDGFEDPVYSGGTVQVDSFEAVYTLTRDIPVDKVFQELPTAEVEFYDGANTEVNTSLKAAAFDYDHDGDGAVECL